MRAMALADLRDGFARHELWLNFALHDIRQRFRRSMLGPFWITISTGITILALALVFGTIFGSDPSAFIPYLSAGMIFWNYFSITMTEGSVIFVQSAADVRSVPIPLSVHLYRMLARNFVVLLHNLVILVVVILVFQHWPTWEWLLIIPGFALFFVVLACGTLAAAIVSTRFRDIPQVIASLLQVVFFLTPIFWSAEQLPQRPAIIALNPAFHLIEVVRAPLLGRAPALESWAVAAGLAAVAVVVAYLLYRRAYPRLAYWV
jgi:ABC-type polysaccharide/polyol phosphate export permease